MNNVFAPIKAHEVRTYLARNTPELGIPEDPGVSVAVVNTADTCPQSCPNCLYSAATVKKLYGNVPPKLTLDDIKRFCLLMNEARLSLLVFSGGGESYENLEAMCVAVEQLDTLREVVTITSGYFSTSDVVTKKVLERLISAMHRGCERRGKKLTFTLRISVDNFHDVPRDRIVRLIETARHMSTNWVIVRVMVRTLLDPAEDIDCGLANSLNGQLLPVKSKSDPVANLPIIDGLPTRWIVDDEFPDIPVIYKPTYFLGYARKRVRHILPGASWREVVVAEESRGEMFNLSKRGDYGEGHNFYEQLFAGYSHWRDTLRESLLVTTPLYSRKRLAVYLPADGRFIINASSPDSWQQITGVISWEEYWKTVMSDPLQQAVVTQPNSLLLQYVCEVEPEIETVLDARNFVFQVPYTALETPALRLYVTIRLLQELWSQVQFKDSYVQELIRTPVDKLRMLYRSARAMNVVVTPQGKKRLIDPIVGSQATVWE